MNTGKHATTHFTFTQTKFLVKYAQLALTEKGNEQNCIIFDFQSSISEIQFWCQVRFPIAQIFFLQ